MSKNRILIIGATGKIGGQLVHLFENESTHHVRLLLRNKEYISRFNPARFELTFGDLENLSDIEEAVKDVDKIFMVTSPGPEQVQLQKNLIDVASKNKDVHIVRISSMGIDPGLQPILSKAWLSQWHYELEKYLENSGALFTHIRPNFFMQNMFGHKPSIQESNKFYGSLKNGKISMVHTDDISAVVYAVLNDVAHVGKTYEITGPEALSFEDIAIYLSENLERSVEYVYLEPEVLKQQLLQAGMPEWFVHDMLVFFAGHSASEASYTTNVVKKLIGRDAKSFQELTKAFD